VLQVRPARSFHRNGQLRITFRQVILPDGVEQTVDTSLQGIESDAAGNVQLDTEGGAKSTPSKTRYLSTGASVGLALIGSGGRRDVGTAGPVTGGATGYKLIGIIVGAVYQNHTYAILMSAYGGGSSIYRNFIARGREIVFPKNTVMDIRFGNRTTLPHAGRRSRTHTMKARSTASIIFTLILFGALSALAQSHPPKHKASGRTRLRSASKRWC
jgi:hypothetical protein